jgi:hypothetical protein
LKKSHYRGVSYLVPPSGYLITLSCIVAEEQGVGKQSARRTLGSKRGELTGKLRKLHYEKFYHLYSSLSIVRAIGRLRGRRMTQ